VRPQGLKCAPYQGLEALYERTRAPLAELQRSEAFAGGAESSEYAVFRDQATNAPIDQVDPTSRNRRTGGGDLGQWALGASGQRCPARQEERVRSAHGANPDASPGKHAFFPADGDRTAMVEFERERRNGADRGQRV
jgi:hypothetical protein